MALTRRDVLTGAAAGVAAGVLGVAPSPPAATAQTAAATSRSAPGRPKVVAFDVIETLFDLKPMGSRLKEAGLPAEVLAQWFATFLRDAFALEVAGAFKTFPEVAASSLAGTMTDHGVRPSRDVIDRVLQGFGELPAHPDVRPAFTALREAGVRIITLTNGSAEATRKLLGRAGLLDMVERTLSIEAVRHWKPRREVYLHAAAECAIPPGDLALVAAHAWDVQGASLAGLVTGWVSRGDGRFPEVMDAPDVQGRSLTDVVRALTALP